MIQVSIRYTLIDPEHCSVQHRTGNTLIGQQNHCRFQEYRACKMRFRMKD